MAYIVAGAMTDISERWSQSMETVTAGETAILQDERYDSRSNRRKNMNTENALSVASVQSIVHTPRMPMADCSLRGKDSRICMATVESGEFAGNDVGVMVQYTDGFCICDMGGDDPMEIIHIDRLRLWIPVKSVSVNPEGVVSYEPL